MSHFFVVIMFQFNELFPRKHNKLLGGEKEKIYNIHTQVTNNNTTFVSNESCSCAEICCIDKYSSDQVDFSLSLFLAVAQCCGAQLFLLPQLGILPLKCMAKGAKNLCKRGQYKCVWHSRRIITTLSWWWSGTESHPGGGGAYISIRVVEPNRINIFSYGSATALDGILRVYPVKIY